MFPSVGKVILIIYGDFLSMSSFNIMKQVLEHGTGFLVPPSRCCLDSEGITLRLDSAKRYQKAFRGSH